MKFLLSIITSLTFMGSLLAMDTEPLYTKKRSRETEITETYGSIFVKTYDGKITEVPMWQIDQIQVLQERLVDQKGENSPDNPISINDITISQGLENTNITADMLQTLIEAFKQSDSDINFSIFFNNLHDSIKQKNLINTAGALNASKISIMILTVAYGIEGQILKEAAPDIAITHQDKNKKIIDYIIQKKHILKGHTKDVTCVAYSPDGNYIVSGSQDKTLILWNAHTREQIKKFEIKHVLNITCVAYHPNGKYIISGSDDGTLIFWNPETGMALGAVNAGAPVTCVMYSPDGNDVISGSKNGTLILWNAHTGEQKQTTATGASVTCITYSSDGKSIVSGLNNGTLILWNPYEQQTKLFESGHASYIKQITYILCDNAQYIVSIARIPQTLDNILIVWDVNTHKPLKKTSASFFFTCLAPNPSRKYITSGTGYGEIVIFNTSTQKYIVPLTAHKLMKNYAEITCMAYSPDGNNIVFGSGNTLIILQDISEMYNLKPEQQKFLYRIYEGTIKYQWGNSQKNKNLKIIITSDDPDYKIYQSLPTSVKNIIHNLFLCTIK